MKNSTIIILITGIVGLGVGYYVAQQTKCKMHSTISHTQCLFLRTMEKLWADHVIWARQFIVSSLAELPDANVAAERLLKNQEDIGNAIIPYYGKEAGQQLTTLLKEHITIAADIVKEAIANNTDKVKELDGQWRKNADDIASFLSNANSLWGKQELLEMFLMHLELTTHELQHRLKMKWKEDVVNFDEIFKQALMMAHQLADGMMKQFPEKF